MSYISNHWWEPENPELVTHSWEEFTHRRLAWLYGPERADSIRAGQDPKTNADLIRWNALGVRGGQAA
jgi:hypothetical protein